MLAIDVCDLPKTGGSTFVVIAGLFVLVAGVIVARWVRESAGRLSVVVAPLVLLGGFVLAPQATDPCAPATTTVPSLTNVATTNSTVPSATTTVPSATTTVAPTTTTTTTSTTTTIAVLTCATGGDCQVGEPGPGGGIVFYDAGSVQPWGRYLEVACAGWSDGTCGGNDLTDPQPVWGCSGTLISGADGTAIGTGEQNTQDIVNGCLTQDIAADRAADYSHNDLDDWFLPSKDELNTLCKWAYGDTVNAICNNNGSGGLSLANGGYSPNFYFYWSSSEFTNNLASTHDFEYGGQYTFSKAFMNGVRPVRAF